MPESYRPHLRKDDEDVRTASQSVKTNTSHTDARVSHFLEKRTGPLHTVRPQDTLQAAIAQLSEYRIGALPVTDAEGALVGILSERDIVRRLATGQSDILPLHVEDLMTRTVETCTPDDPLLTVLQRMTEGRFRHMPVLDHEDLIGLVSIGDVVHFRLQQLELEALQMKQLIVG